MNKDLVVNNLKINNNNDLTNDMASIISNGSLLIKKGIKIGFQSNPINGMIVFDNDNFLGYSNKFGWDIINNHNFFLEIILPDEFKLNPDKNIIVQDDKNIFNLDLNIEDSKYFYLKFDNNTLKIKLLININLVNNYNNIIKIIFINESQNDIDFSFTNTNLKFYNKIDKILTNKILECDVCLIENITLIKYLQYD